MIRTLSESLAGGGGDPFVRTSESMICLLVWPFLSSFLCLL